MFLLSFWSEYGGDKLIKGGIYMQPLLVQENIISWVVPPPSNSGNEGL